MGENNEIFLNFYKRMKCLRAFKNPGKFLKPWKIPTTVDQHSK